MKKYFKIGEISKLYNIGVDSLRYYEKIGLISPLRADSKYRLYSIDDIWRLNVIRELRELGFPMKKIKEYLDSHTIKATLDFLKEEEKIVCDKLQSLKTLQENVEKRINNIFNAQNTILDEIQVKHIKERKCFSISEGYFYESEMDILIKRLVNIDKSHFYIIGNDQIGSTVNTENLIKDGQAKYNSVFIISKNGNKTLEAGDYLTICYSGDYKKSSPYMKRLLEFGKNQGYELDNKFLELILTDIHTTKNINEHITEIQIMIKNKNIQNGGKNFD